MIRRGIALALVLWALGFVWFAGALPQPAGKQRTDAIVVATGSGERIPHGLALLRGGEAARMLVTGVDEKVRPGEFSAHYQVSPEEMACCVTLGFAALDTRGNARETADWAEAHKVKSIRLVTSDWHMRRAALELSGRLPAGITVVRDATRTHPTLWMLFIEYHKLIAVWLVQTWQGG